MANHTATIEVPSATHSQGSPNIFAPDAVMFVLTWVTFFSLLFVLQKFAWKPILATLKKREDSIRDSLHNADQIKSELENIQLSKEKVLSDAHKAAQEIVDQSRKRAQDIARGIEEATRHQTQEMTRAAHQEIEGEKERVKLALRRESAEIAVALAGKIMNENMNQEKNHKIIDQFLKEV